MDILSEIGWGAIWFDFSSISWCQVWFLYGWIHKCCEVVSTTCKLPVQSPSIGNSLRCPRPIDDSTVNHCVIGRWANQIMLRLPRNDHMNYLLRLKRADTIYFDYASTKYLDQIKWGHLTGKSILFTLSSYRMQIIQNANPWHQISRTQWFG